MLITRQPWDIKIGGNYETNFCEDKIKLFEFHCINCPGEN